MNFEKYKKELEVEKLLICAAIACNIDSKNIFEKRRDFDIVSARAIVSYYMRNKWGWSINKISDFLSQHRTTVTKNIYDYEWRVKYDARFKENVERFKMVYENQD